MAKKQKFTKDEANLITRYLIWCYKTTKESLDRIDRYFTQNYVDQFILKELEKKNVKFKNDKFSASVAGFNEYMKKKQARVLKQKFSDDDAKILNADYLYLFERLSAIEKAVVSFLGKKKLDDIKNMYEEEMMLRILESKDDD